MAWPLHLGNKSFKVIGNEEMALFDSSHMNAYWRSIVTAPILHSFRHRARYWLKIAIFIWCRQSNESTMLGSIHQTATLIRKSGLITIRLNRGLRSPRPLWLSIVRSVLDALESTTSQTLTILVFLLLKLTATSCQMAERLRPFRATAGIFKRPTDLYDSSHACPQYVCKLYCHRLRKNF